MASSTINLPNPQKVTLLKNSALEKAKAVFHSDNKMTSDEFLAFFRYECTIERITELQTSMSKALALVVLQFGVHKGQSIVEEYSDKWLLPQLMKGKWFTEDDFPMGDWAHKSVDAKKLYDDFFAESRKLLVELFIKHKVNILAELRTCAPEGSSLGPAFGDMERFCKEYMEFEKEIDLDQVAPTPPLCPNVITLNELYDEWVMSAKKEKVIIA